MAELRPSTEGDSSILKEVRYRHKKRGTVYRILHTGKFQTSMTTDMEGRPLDLDDEICIVYQDVTDPLKIWVRLEDEFFDGRFEVLK